MTLSGLLLKPLDKMDFSIVRKTPRSQEKIQGWMEKTQDLRRKSKEW